jgi:hypothetical protein
MRLSWPIEDLQRRKLDLINDALEDYREVVARTGHISAGLPHDWDIETRRTGGGRRTCDYLVCYVEVVPAREEAA